jgi:hypothetical protein
MPVLSCTELDRKIPGREEIGEHQKISFENFYEEHEQPKRVHILHCIGHHAKGVARKNRVHNGNWTTNQSLLSVRRRLI